MFIKDAEEKIKQSFSFSTNGPTGAPILRSPVEKFPLLTPTEALCQVRMSAFLRIFSCHKLEIFFGWDA